MRQGEHIIDSLIFTVPNFILQSQIDFPLPFHGTFELIIFGQFFLTASAIPDTVSYLSKTLNDLGCSAMTFPDG